MKAIHLVLVSLVLQACAIEPEAEPESIELELSGKTDGYAEGFAILDPGRKIGISWLCQEWLEVNGCDITLELRAEPLERSAIAAGTRIGTLAHLDVRTKVRTEHPVVIGSSKLLIEAAGISGHAAVLENTSSKKLSFRITAEWQ